MKTLFAIGALTLVSGAAQAATTTKFSCGLTEPFYSLEIDLAKSTITKTEPNWENNGEGLVTKVVARNIHVTSTSDRYKKKTTLREQSGKVFATVELTHKGSDGMSNFVYPYEIRVKRAGEMDHYGGCESNLLTGKDEE